MYIFNYDGTEAINPAHIIKVYIDGPNYGESGKRVCADLTYGTALLFKGTEKDCIEYLNRFN